jgi:hypothetical protein
LADMGPHAALPTAAPAMAAVGGKQNDGFWDSRVQSRHSGDLNH